METITAFSTIALAALVHASFQLGVSMVTLLSNHATGKKLSGQRVLRLVGAFLLGTVVMTGLLISSFGYAATVLFHGVIPEGVWESAAVALAIVGAGVWVFYYRRGDGTSLWLPRPLAHLLHERIQVTTFSAEAFSLGLTAVIAEIIFLLVPVSAAALAIVSLPVVWQPLAVLLYIFVASLGLIVVSVLLGSGRKLYHIQEWRESNKRFLQFSTGCGLFVLSAYIYVNQVVAVAAAVGGR